MNTVLTTEEIEAIDEQVDGGLFGQQTAVDFARAIEAAVLAKFGEPVATYEGHFKLLDVGIAKEHCIIPEGTPLYAIKKEGA